MRSFLVQLCCRHFSLLPRLTRRLHISCHIVCLERCSSINSFCNKRSFYPSWIPLSVLKWIKLNINQVCILLLKDPIATRLESPLCQSLETFCDLVCGWCYCCIVNGPRKNHINNLGQENLTQPQTKTIINLIYQNRSPPT